ncbi:hypothetical protein M0812_06350 [Anaeramoeba flamelloides]|uniref:Uncharacterized protein n=1 Tax=Anaeramoeba flamelloides TaxID=1746091 RepID=A0AAV8ACF5_9EUKA|nr:hypothetical protein M0812_06350 [Anaeramoeba flamelloides]
MKNNGELQTPNRNTDRSNRIENSQKRKNRPRELIDMEDSPTKISRNNSNLTDQKGRYSVTKNKLYHINTINPTPVQRILYPSNRLSTPNRIIEHHQSNDLNQRPNITTEYFQPINPDFNDLVLVQEQRFTKDTNKENSNLRTSRGRGRSNGRGRGRGRGRSRGMGNSNSKGRSNRGESSGSGRRNGNDRSRTNERERSNESNSRDRDRTSDSERINERERGRKSRESDRGRSNERERSNESSGNNRGSSRNRERTNDRRNSRDRGNDRGSDRRNSRDSCNSSNSRGRKNSKRCGHRRNNYRGKVHGRERRDHFFQVTVKIHRILKDPQSQHTKDKHPNATD